MATKVKLIADNVVTAAMIDTTATPTFGGITVNGDATVTGDLNITGNLNSYNVTDLDVTDQTITLGAGQTEALSGGSGIIVDGSNASILWDETNDEWDFNKDITTTGYIGAGTSNPANLLHLESSGSNFATIRLNAPSNTTPGQFLLRAHDGVFDIRNANNSTTDLTIDASGNVGIGTSSPAELLHVYEASTSAARIRLANTDGYLEIGTNNQVMNLDSQTHTFRNEAGSSEYMRIDSSGNVGIGTTSPDEKLVVDGDIKIRSTNKLHFTNTSDLTSIHAPGSNLMAFSTNGSERMRIDSSGDVGIATNSPDDRLHLVDNSSNNFTTGLRLGTTYNSVYSRISVNFGGAMTLNAGVGGGTSALIAQVDGSEKMRIDSSGSLGLGTNNPGSLLHVAHSNSGTNPTARIENTVGTVATNSVLLDLKFSGDDSFSNCDYVKFQDSSGEEGVITGDGGGRVYYEITSDYRKKENIIDYTGGLNVVNNLSVKNYNMITNPNITYTGFIAHEVQEVVDGVARGIKDAVDDEGNPIYQGLDMSKLVPHLVSAIQEQQTIIDELKARIEVLEG